MAEQERMFRALEAANQAGDEEGAREIAAMIREQQGPQAPATPDQAAPATGADMPPPGENPFWNDPEERDRVSTPQAGPGYSFLEERGINVNEQPRARELFDAVTEAQRAGDAEAERRAQVRLAGYLDGQDALDGQRGQESALEGTASRAETALRGFGQGAFGLGDFSAALGSWIGEGGPMSDFSLRDHFAYQRNRREGMAQQNRGTATAGYLGGAVFGGGGIASGATRAGARIPGAVGRRIGQTFTRRAGARGEIGRAAAGAAASSGTAAALEGGDVGEVAQATALGAVAGPVGEKVIDVGAGAVRGAMRRINPERAADAALQRRLMEGEDMADPEAAVRLEQRLEELGPDATLIQTVNPRRAQQLGDEATQSPDAMDLVTARTPQIEDAGAARMQRAVQGRDAPISVDEVRANESERFTTARRQEARAAGDDVRTINRAGRDRLIERGQQFDSAREEGQQAVAAATRRLQERLVRRADSGRGGDVTPQAIEASRKQFADEVMGEIGEGTVRVPRASNALQRDAVRNVIRSYASAADPEEAAALRDLLNLAPEDISSVTFTVRQVDSFRRALDEIGSNDPAVKQGLRDVANMFSEAAGRNPAYANYLDVYSRLSRRMEGAQLGERARSAPMSGIQDDIRLQRDAQQVGDSQTGDFEVGLRRRSARALSEEAARSPERARRLAREVVEEPDRYETILGRPRAEGVGRVAQAGLDEIQEAEAALTQLQRLQRADEEEIRRITADRAVARSQEGQDRIDSLRDQMERRMVPIERAQAVMNAGTEDFTRAANVARDEGMDNEFRRVARTALAEAAGESATGAQTVAQALARNPGLRTRVAEVLGEDVASILQETGRRESGAADALVSFRSGAARNLGDLDKKEKQALISAVDLGVMATDRWSGSFGANAFIRLMRQVNGDEDRALALARALTGGDRATQRRTLARLGQLGASIREQKMYAQAAGVGAGIIAGQAVAEDIE